MCDVPVAEVWLLFQNLITSQLIFKYSPESRWPLHKPSVTLLLVYLHEHCLRHKQLWSRSTIIFGSHVLIFVFVQPVLCAVLTSRLCRLRHSLK